MAELLTASVNVFDPDARNVTHYTAAYFGTRRAETPIRATQYDASLPVVAVTLYNPSLQPYIIPADAAVNIRMDKKDGNYIYNAVKGVSQDRRVVYFELSTQMTVNPGDFELIVEVVSGGMVAATCRLALIIEKNPVPDDAVISESEMTILETFAQTKAAADAAVLAANNAIDEASSAYSSAQTATEMANAATTAAAQANETANAATTAAADAASAANSVVETANTALSTANSASSTANDAASTASAASTAAANAQTTADAAMPKAGGTFTGVVYAQNTARSGTCLRNILFQNSSGTSISSNYLIARRK